MGTIFVDNLEPQSGTNLTLGSSGDTVTLTSGAKTSGFGKIGQVQSTSLSEDINTTSTSFVATNITDVNTFANRYRIASSAPSTSLDVGDLYFDTSSNELRVYNGSAWQGGVTATGSLAGLTSNTFSGNQTINANIINQK